MNVNEIINVECIDISFEGLGVCKYNGIVVFVDNLLIGEKAEVIITKVTKKYVKAEVISLLEKSLKRVVPECEFYDLCGGCAISHLSDEFKNDVKYNYFYNSTKIKAHNCLTNQNILGYRNKVVMHVDKVNGQIVSGPYKKMSKTIVGSKCLMLNEIGRDIHRQLLDIFNQSNIDVYDYQTNLGSLKEIVYRRNNQNQFMVIFVVCEDDSNLENVLKSFSHPNVVSIYLNYCDKKSKHILGNVDKLVKGEKYLKNKISEIEYYISPQSFFQINNDVTYQMFEKIIEIANFNGSEQVLDAYSGIGAISLYISKYVKNVVGIDINSSSIDDAFKNKELNDIDNVTFICGDVAKVVKQMKINFDTLIIDPPRKGCSKQFLNFIVTNNFRTIIYMSCNPVSLARDLKFLKEYDYQIQDAYVYDMFPHTTHVESIVLLQK